jgi:acetyltransferase-like isoleucine patch superfamily enzyme
MQRPVRISAGCFVGAAATILAGVTIGAESCVAAGGIVTSDVEPKCMVGGIPARVIRRLDGAAGPL